MSRRLDWVFPWLVSYELVELERIDRSGGKGAYTYPAAVPVDPQQELAARPILEVRPSNRAPWVAIFSARAISSRREPLGIS